jgi:hypothetical protein
MNGAVKVLPPDARYYLCRFSFTIYPVSSGIRMDNNSDGDRESEPLARLAHASAGYPSSIVRPAAFRSLALQQSSLTWQPRL